MTAQTATIADFLLARIAEDEAVARSIALDPSGVARQRFGKVGRMQWFALAVDRPWVDGIARVLAECEAKRRIVELHALVPRPGRDEDPWICAQCGEAPGEEFGWCPWPCDTLRALALPYADHPDWREEWRA